MEFVKEAPANSMFREMVENLGQYVLSFTQEHGVLSISTAWLERLGLTEREVIGRALFDLIRPNDPKDAQVALVGISEGVRNRFDFVGTIARANGSRLTFSVRICRYPSSLQRPVMVGVADDVTAQVEAESRYRAMAEDLRRANQIATTARDAALAASRAKGQFLANMSHEVRTPLNGVLGMASLLLEQSEDEEARECIRTIQSSGETLLRVIDDVLEFSRMEVGRLEIENAPVSLKEFVADLVQMFEAHGNAQRVHLKCSGPEIVPTVMTDPLRLRQILANLLSNAIKFTPEGEVEIHWNVEGEGSDRIVRFEVVDSGIGIPLERQEEIFESFTQADATFRRQFGGTGLGLSIAQRLTQMMGGRIGVSSDPGHGSRFWVELPTHLAENASLPELGAEATDFNGLRVLVAEDNPVNVKVAQKLLERLGCRVDIADNGMAAIAMALQEAYDVVLMDVQMPVCDGIEATGAIRHQEEQRGGHVPIVAVTANTRAEDREACARAGMDGFLAKPLTLRSLAKGLAPFAKQDGDEGRFFTAA